MNISVFKGKPLEKLIEVVSNGIGRLYNPLAIKYEAKAEAYKIKVIEKAKAEALAENKIIEAQTLSRLSDKIVFEETKRLMNLDSVINIAAEQIKTETSVSEKQVDPDWTRRFFNIAQDVSDEEMQKLWGRILSGEVKAPSTYSLRTLETLKNLTKEEAQIFSKIARFAIFDGEDGKATAFILKDLSLDYFKKRYNINFDERMTLQEIGLINDSEKISQELFNKNNIEVFRFGDKIVKFLLSDTAAVRFHYINIIPFTRVGRELLGLVDAVFNNDYCNDFINRVNKTDVTVTVS